jgi:hypothetical protein
MSDRRASISQSSFAPAKGLTPSSAARTKLLLEGPILPTLLRLAAPNVLNLFAFAGVITFDERGGCSVEGRPDRRGG